MTQKADGSCLILGYTSTRESLLPVTALHPCQIQNYSKAPYRTAWKYVKVLVTEQSGRPFATPWTVAHQARLSMGFPRQEYYK